MQPATIKLCSEGIKNYISSKGQRLCSLVQIYAAAAQLFAGKACDPWHILPKFVGRICWGKQDFPIPYFFGNICLWEDSIWCWSQKSSLTTTPNMVMNLSLHLVIHQIHHQIWWRIHKIHHQICYQFHHQIWRFTKIITEFGDKFVTKFITKHLGLIHPPPMIITNHTPSHLQRHWWAQRYFGAFTWFIWKSGQNLSKASISAYPLFLSLERPSSMPIYSFDSR